MTHTALSIHAPLAKAKAYGTTGEPLILTTADGAHQVTFFCEDAELASSLAQAINAAIADHAARTKEPA